MVHQEANYCYSNCQNVEYYKVERRPRQGAVQNKTSMLKQSLAEKLASTLVLFHKYSAYHTPQFGPDCSSEEHTSLQYRESEFDRDAHTAHQPLPGHSLTLLSRSQIVDCRQLVSSSMIIGKSPFSRGSSLSKGLHHLLCSYQMGC